MKLKAIQTYQSVKFQQKQDHYFDSSRAGMEGTEITLVDNKYVVLKSAKDHIIVFTANIAYAIPGDAADTVPTNEKARGILKDIDHTKAPKRS